MWIEELSNGKFKYVERYTDRYGKDRKVSLTHTKNNNRVKKEMMFALQEKIDKKLTTKTNENLTFEEASEKWHGVWKKTVRASTAQDRRRKLTTINKSIGTYNISILTAGDINRYILELFDEGFKYSSVKNYISVVKQVLRFCYDYDIMDDTHVIDRIKIPEINLPESSNWKYLEREELNQLVDNLRSGGEHEKARMCLIQTYTGMRFGEMVALDYTQHIDFKDHVIHIERSWAKNVQEFNPPKTGQKRIIAINKQTEKLLHEQIKYSKMKKMKYNLDRDTHLLFTSWNNTPTNLSLVDKALKKYSGFTDKNITTHIFRHTFITLMIEKNVPAKLIAEHVGHDNTNMIEQVYSHFTNKMDNDLTEAIRSFSV